ncbi:hypothetical protein [Hydrogenophaga sp.]|uniref:hypothetical protein n=1 Tax=Hydrogenophaga sp. TaxID=1904254 RepID=UPI002730626A|nr:hypothetical protein [Hydrogenophaga sp.]MDP2015100.1 hypothetical protein [Hydrogenophaga sp.]MDP3164959.1 hypothetical protein [Hydrogenophaga sp.]MDP3812231.1 hypothetical protein [Hydrogenophaga sp.]
MDETDAFFTHTIVGAPFSVLLGRRQGPSSASTQGLEVPLGDGSVGLSEGWRGWALLDHVDTPAGKPRPRPKVLRRWLERHALLIALFGVLMLLGSTVFWAITLLPATGWVPASWMERWPWN